MNMYQFIDKLKSNSKLLDIRDIAKECGFIFSHPKIIPKIIKTPNGHFITVSNPHLVNDYDDESLIKEINYNTLSYSYLKNNNIYCRTAKLKYYLNKINIENDENIKFMTIAKADYGIYNEEFKDFSKINIEKMASILIESGQIIIDSNLQKISVRTKVEIEKVEIIETCECSIYFKHLNSKIDNIAGNGMNYNTIPHQKYTCNKCKKVIKGQEHNFVLEKNKFKSW